MFAQVPPSEISAAWPRIALGVQRIIRRTRPAWTAGAVLDKLESSHARLFVNDDGFVVLEVDYEWGRPFLNVWLAHFKPTRAKAVRAEFVAWLDRMALNTVGSKDWRFSSPRKGWKGIEPDCEVHMIIWRRKQ